jgi:hypothetical protein
MDRKDSMDYAIEVNGITFKIRLPHDAEKWPFTSEFFKRNRHLFHGLLHNNEWFEDEEVLIKIYSLKELLLRRKVSFSPSELLERIFVKFFDMQDEIGQHKLMSKRTFDDEVTFPNYFKSSEEALFFANELKAQGLLYWDDLNAMGFSRFDFNWQITFKGLTYYNKLTSEGEQSKMCFIAMSFNEKTRQIRAAIKDALIETGYEHIIIDEQHTSSDQTINDAIIAALRRCKFCIADFSFHSNGVYFESGFALGQGKQVIYTCSKEEFANAHFDIRPLQHIIYENPEELKKALVHKIEAWIK